MLTKFCRFAFRRHFSNSIVWRNLEKKPVEESSGSAGLLMTRVPSEFEKKILVYSGRYKSIEDVPTQVTSQALDKAKSKVRIKIANIMIVVVLTACGWVIYTGKQERKEKVRVELERQAEKKAQL